MILKENVTGYQVGKEKFSTYREAWQHSQATGKPIKTLGTRKVWSAHYRQYVGLADEKDEE